MRYLLLAAACLAAAPCLSADPTLVPPKTIMTAPGKLLQSFPLTAALGKPWNAAKGKWELADGTTRVSELKADAHGAVARCAMKMKDVVVHYSFKLEGARNTSLSFNGAKGHICRASVSPTRFSVSKDDQDGKNGPDMAETLDTRAVTIEPGVWHTLTVELRGADILATLDGRVTVYGSHPAIDKPKANFGLTVGGETVSFKSLSVWEANASPDWEARKARLGAERE